jgi:hypothetical protein
VNTAFSHHGSIYFVARHLRRRWPELDSDTAWMPMDAGPASRWSPLETVWIVSTDLRLRGAGQDVRIVDRPVSGAINICCDERAGVTGDSSGAFLVLTQGDRDPLPWADYRLVQSPEQMNDRCVSLIKHWPQPGLIPRDASRGNRLERVGYVGPVENLAAGFRDDAFRGAMRALGVELVIRDDPAQWHDFADLDAYLAVRDWPWHLIRTKPATKLVHAWLTGAIGLLGPEPSYRHWGSDGEDYFEVRTPEDVLRVVQRLKADPAIGGRVRQRGQEKGREHDEQAVIRQWIEVLNGPVREAFERWRQAGPLTWQARRVRRQWQRVMAPISQKIFTVRSRGWRAVTRKLARAGGQATA